MKITGESAHLDFLRRHYLDMPDFNKVLDTTNEFEFTSDSNGAATVADGTEGEVTLDPSDGTTAEDEAYLAAKYEKFKFLADRPIHWEQEVQFTEADTNAANVIAGFKDAVGADTLQDAGAGPPSSYYGCVFYKVDGETVWRTEVSIGTTQYTKQLTADVSLDSIAKTAGGASYQKLEIDCYMRGGSGGTRMDVVFTIDGVVVSKETDISIGTPTEMQPFFGVKQGSAVEQTAKGKPWICYQRRGE